MSTEYWAYLVYNMFTKLATTGYMSYVHNCISVTLHISCRSLSMRFGFVQTEMDLQNASYKDSVPWSIKYHHLVGQSVQ